jgi:RNA polymerase sigma-70 factor, ECF subfamily
MGAARVGDGSRRPFRAIVDDASRFRAWYDEALPLVYGYLLARCGDPSRAEELTQRAMIRAVRARASFRGDADPVTWICAIGRNLLIDDVRRRRRDLDRAVRIMDRATVADSAWERHERRRDVSAALDGLPPDQRLALTLQHLDGYTVREIATALRRSESATESLLTRARDGFRRAYEGQTNA